MTSSGRFTRASGRGRCRWKCERCWDTSPERHDGRFTSATSSAVKFMSQSTFAARGRNAGVGGDPPIHTIHTIHPYHPNTIHTIHPSTADGARRRAGKLLSYRVRGGAMSQIGSRPVCGS